MRGGEEDVMGDREDLCIMGGGWEEGWVGGWGFDGIRLLWAS